MGAKRVVLLSHRSLLAASVERLLTGAEGIDLSIVSGDDPRCGAELNRIAPEVIVIDSGDGNFGQSSISHLLVEHPSARIVAVNLERGYIQIFAVKRVMQTTPQGLMKAIRGRVAPVSGRKRVGAPKNRAGAENGDE